MTTTTKTRVTSGDLLPFRDLTKMLERFKVACVAQENAKAITDLAGAAK